MEPMADIANTLNFPLGKRSSSRAAGPETWGIPERQPVQVANATTSATVIDSVTNVEGQRTEPQPTLLPQSVQTATKMEPGMCLSCAGAGWLRKDVPFGDPQFGKLYPCVCRLQTAKQRDMDELYRRSNLAQFQTKVFGTFDPEREHGVEEAYQAATDYATYPSGWLLLLGGCGTGKTHLAAAIANYLVQGFEMQVYFAVAPDLLHFLRLGFGADSDASYDQRFEQIRTVDVLIIDDLGAEQGTAWAIEQLYQILNYRYNGRLPTVITSNCDIDRLDPRIRSRMCDPDLCRHVFVSATDYRMRRMEKPVASQRGGMRPPSAPGNASYERGKRG